MKLAARMQKKQWVVFPGSNDAGELARQLRVSPLLAQVMINRRVDTAEIGKDFLNPKLSELIPPEQMPGVPEAAERIAKAIADKEKITIYGDYDVDGITSTAILWYMLKLLDADVDYYIPHRIDEGYGLNEDAITQIAEAGTKLIITVDCGITATKSAELLAQLGVDLVITDHHQPEGTLPRAAAIVHPGLNGYANPASAGAMVAFKLAWGLANKLYGAGKLADPLRGFLVNATMFAAMGTVADVVELLGENRIIAGFGLKALPQSELPGIKALISSAGLTGKELDSYHIGFHLAPMLNAAGRMGHARLAVELLTSDNELRSMRISEYLKDQNKQRQQLGQKIFKQSCEKISSSKLDHPNRKSIIMADEDWHCGIIGITASRIVDKYCRPTILLQTNGSTATGSGRSVDGFDILEAIRACSGYLVRFGGHAMAVGVTIETENIHHFAAAFERYAQQNLSETDTVAKLQIEALCPVSIFTPQLVLELQLLGPFGKANPEPVFATEAVHLLNPPKKVGARGDHLQFTISDNTAAVRCIAFGMGYLEKKLLETEVFHIAYKAKLDTYNGSNNIQFMIEDIQFE